MNRYDKTKWWLYSHRACPQFSFANFKCSIHQVKKRIVIYETRSFSLMIEIHRKSIVWVCRNQYRSRRIFNQFFQVDLYWKFVWKSQSWARRRRKTLTMTSIFSCKNRKKFWEGRDVVGTIWMILPQYAIPGGGWFQIMTRPGMYVWKLTKSTMCLLLK